MATVSIIVPIYNMEKYLRRCLLSIQQQSFSNFEVFMIDDGSQDNTAAICKEFTTDARFHYYYQNNSGVSVARNEGIKRSTGKWISFIDPDDYWKPEFLKILLSKTEKGEIVCCSFFTSKDNIEQPYNLFQGVERDCIFSDEIQTEQEKVFSKRHLFIQLMDRNYKGKKPSAIGVPWGKLYSSEFLKENLLLFEPSLIRMQDNIFNMHAFFLARSIYYINKPLYGYNMDHLIYFGTKYDPDAKEYLPLICKNRLCFLKESGLYKDPLFKSLYCNETINLLGIIMRMYYIHSNNAQKNATKEEEIRAQLTSPEFHEAFFARGVNLTNINKLRTFFARHNNLLAYMYFEKLLNYIRNKKLQIMGNV